MSCVTFIFLLALALPVQAATEKWICQGSPYADWKDILVIATSNGDNYSGTLRVAAITYNTQYQVQGFDRRWDFGSVKENSSYSYSFVISPDGDARYYDFTSGASVKPSQLMWCKQIG